MNDEIEDLEIKLSKLHGNLDEIKADIRISVKRENWNKLEEELAEYEGLLTDIQDLSSKIRGKVKSLQKNEKIK